MHQHDLHAHALNQCQVLRQVLQLARRNGLARNAHHKGLAPVHVDVGRHRAEPGHKCEVEYGRHAGSWAAGVWGEVQKCSSQLRGCLDVARIL